jgi:hypothetical protein
MKVGQDISLIYSGSTSAAFAALVNGRVQGIFATAPNDTRLPLRVLSRCWNWVI